LGFDGSRFGTEYVTPRAARATTTAVMPSAPNRAVVQGGRQRRGLMLMYIGTSLS
jgi:hypothetical protein